MDFCTCLFNSRSLSSMKDDAYIYNNVITCIFWCKIFNASALWNIPSQTLPLGSAALPSLVSRSADCSQHLC